MGRSWLLAIDTSTDQAGVALFDGEHVAEHSWPGGRQQTTTVLPVIQRLLEAQGLAMADIGAVAVATGPGSFTGLRVGLSLAKGLAIEGDRVVTGVGTLDIAAAPYRETHTPCLALVPAGRGRVVWSFYPARGPASEPANTTFANFLEVLPRHAGAFVVGELSAEQRSNVADVHERLASTALSLRRPGVLAELGFLRWRLGETDDPATLEPVYLHGQPNPR